jgi:chromosomal replication initiation ATPase DnaA
MTEQIPLPFKAQISYSIESFIRVLEQDEVLQYLDGASDLPLRGLYVYGPLKSGKTYLAHMFAQKGFKMVSCVEDALLACEDVVINAVTSEIDLFHIINHIFGIPKKVILFLPFYLQDIALPDLRSRLQLLNFIKIKDPSEEFMKILFFKQFSDYQLNVHEEVIDFLILRIPREYKSVYDMVELLNQESIIRKRTITIPFIKDIFQM